MNPQIAAMSPNFAEQRMPREPRVNLRDQFHGQFHALRVGLGRVQRAIAEVVVDMPHALPGAFAGHTDQLRAPSTQTDGGQPARRHQFVALADARFEPLDHEGTRAPVQGETQAMHASAGRFQRLLLQETARRDRPAQQIRQQPAQFRETRLFRRYQQLVQSFNHGGSS